MTKCQKDPTCGIFLKRGLCKDTKNHISVCQTIQNTNTKYTNTAYNEVPETPNIWHIFEKRIIQGYHKWYSHMSNRQIQKCKYTNTQIQSIQRSDRKKHVAYFCNSCTIVQIWLMQNPHSLLGLVLTPDNKNIFLTPVIFDRSIYLMFLTKNILLPFIYSWGGHI